MRDFKKLEIWRSAMDISLDVYRITGLLPDEEKFGLVSQMRRSAVSMPSNIAESMGRESDKEKERFIEYAISSSFELETQLILCKELQYANVETFEGILQILSELQKRIYKFKMALNNSKYH
ncbi:MAG: four helix bundle protein [Bacteroidetes bacterium]|nr:four helix bundle protein [Bacteroidota bacterium]